MAGACYKCTVTLSVFKRSLSVAPRGCSSAPRYQLACWRLGERGLQEAYRASSAVRPAGFYRHTASVCLSCQESMSESLRTCYAYLNQTSRSFAAVIQALDGELRWVTAGGGTELQVRRGVSSAGMSAPQWAAPQLRCFLLFKTLFRNNYFPTFNLQATQSRYYLTLTLFVLIFRESFAFFNFF